MYKSLVGTILTTCMLLLLFSACDEVEAPDVHENRWLYYAVGGNNTLHDAGFYRFDLLTVGSQELEGKHIAHVTQVAENGIVLYRTQTGSSTALYGHCEDGSIIPVPFPVSENPLYKYRYSFPPQVALSSQGHHAVYPVSLVLRGVQNPTRQFPFIVRFNCSKWEMTLIPVDSIITSIMSTLGAEQGRIRGNELLISGDGSTVWFSAAGLTNAPQPDTVGHALLEWKNGTVSVLRGIGNTPFELEGFNERTQTLLFREGMQRFAMNTRTGLTEIFPVPTLTTVRSQQVCVNYDAIALWENDALTVRKASDGSSIYPVISRAEVENRFGNEYTFDERNTISMAPDGIWIAFTLSRVDEPLQCDLFVVRGNGTEIFRVAGRLRHGIASISGEIHQ